MLLLVCAIIALVWANTPWSDSYFSLLETTVTAAIGGFEISKSLLLWINDGLMALFFFVVGLEIKREVMIGELADRKKAALAVAGALGGMAVPALVYVIVNLGTDTLDGWGIPMATDIAFALGILALMGDRAPLSLKVFLAALAIVDDLGAVLVIALFYTAEISAGYLLAGGVFLAALVFANRLGIHKTFVYVLLGIGLWACVLKSGIHATVAGVLLAMCIPARRKIDAPSFLERAKKLLYEFEEDLKPGITEPTTDQRGALHAMEVASTNAESPLIRMEHAMHSWSAFFIVPVFAFANAGVAFGGDINVFSGVSLGIILGLFVGKQIGVFGMAWLAVKMGWANMPSGVSWMQIWGVSLLCGIGFTMSLFIAGLAFTDAATIDNAKVGILLASLISGAVAWVVLSRAKGASTKAA